MDQAPLGIVLAGGHARRMGGGDKGLLPFQGGTLLDAVVGRLAPQCAGLLLSANGDPARFAWLGLPVVPDHPEDGGAGPLAGVLAGLDAAAALDPGASEALTVPTDTPLLPADLVDRLRVARRLAGSEVAIARSAGRDHPTVALWRLDARPALRRLLREHRLRRLAGAQAALGYTVDEWPVEDRDPFTNVNTPAELAALMEPDGAARDSCRQPILSRMPS